MIGNSVVKCDMHVYRVCGTHDNRYFHRASRNSIKTVIAENDNESSAYQVWQVSANGGLNRCLIRFKLSWQKQV